MKTKAKKQINIIDVIIILALLALACATVFKIVSNISAADDSVGITYVLKVDNLKSEFASNVSAGDSVFDHSTSLKIGTVSATSSAQAYHSGTDLQGKPVSSPIEGQSVLYITVETEATKSHIGYAVNDTVLSVGRTFDIRLPNLFASAECISIEQTEQQS